MARQIVVLDREQTAALAFKVAYWPAVPAARQPHFADPDRVSQFRDATQAEIDALRSGAVAEIVETASFPSGTGTAAVKAALVTRFGQIQAAVNGANQWQWYGTAYDPATTTWTDTGA